MNSSSSKSDYLKVRLARSLSNTCGNSSSKYKHSRTRRWRGGHQIRYGRMSWTTL